MARDNPMVPQGIKQCHKIILYIDNNTNIIRDTINSKDYEEILEDRKRSEESKKEKRTPNLKIKNKSAQKN